MSNCGASKCGMRQVTTHAAFNHLGSSDSVCLLTWGDKQAAGGSLCRLYDTYSRCLSVGYSTRMCGVSQATWTQNSEGIPSPNVFYSFNLYLFRGGSLRGSLFSFRNVLITFTPSTPQYNHSLICSTTEQLHWLGLRAPQWW